ncbi:hypothetical protein BJ138DRAFT_757512 [Hygrophoropsis aurantiaca]|uniref:Uncharacterized protein n=1 Tax=Hygrophoropsis aurantiaca TaxID=72124 RepID=A0ACB8AJC1_9AGAM|nr:hypothetical protein BJ138DRAFT_757512 [Hygrophoropsis aurantiaca]
MMAPASAPINDNSWSFNYRTRGAHCPDSDGSEDSADDGNDCPPVLSEDSRFLQEMESSTNQETVEYKPNPWRIAKINAACRVAPSLASEESVSSKSDARPASKAPKGRIVDAFKKQAQRPVAPKLPAQPKPKLKSLTISDPKSAVIRRQGGPNPLAAMCSAIGNITDSFKPLNPHPRSIARDPPHIPRVNVSNDTLSPAKHPPVQAVHPRQYEEPKVIQTPTNRAHIPGQAIRTEVQRFNPAISFSSPAKGLTPSHYARDLSSQSSPLRPTYHPSESTGQPISYLHSQRKNSVRCRQPGEHLNRGFRPMLTPLLPSSSHPVRLDDSHVGPTPHGASMGSLPSPQSPDDNTFAYNIASISTQPRNVADQRTPPVNVGHSNAMPQWLASTIQQSILSPYSQTPPIPTDHRVPETNHPLNMTQPSPMPRNGMEAKRRRSPSPDTSPSPKPRPRKFPPHPPRTISPAFTQKSSAYSFAPDENNDEAWSTLPSRKKSRTLQGGQRKATVKQSGGFRLPMPGLRMPVKNNSASRQPDTDLSTNKTKRRVITYLPPPMTTSSEPDDDVFQDEIPADTNDVSRPVECSVIPEDTSVFDVDTLVALPDSDGITLVDDGEDTTIDCDLTDLVARYPDTKKLLKEQKRLRLQFLDLLDLPSCGIVWRDDDNHLLEQDMPPELQIVLWPLFNDNPRIEE